MKTLAVLLCAGVAFAQTPAKKQEPAFKLSEVEALKGEVIKAHRQVAEMACAPGISSVRAEFAKWRDDTLAAHGNPQDVVFDEVNWQFVPMPKMTPEQIEAKKARDARASALQRAMAKEAEDMKAHQALKNQPNK